MSKCENTFKIDAKEIFNRFKKESKNPKTELNFLNDYTFLVAVILSAQSTDKQVNVITKDLFNNLIKPEDAAIMGLDELSKSVKSIGLWSSKAKNIYKMSEILVKQFNSKVPSNFKDLTSLPGVGAKSANVVLNVLFNKPVIAVDRHVLRVSNRIGLSDGKTPNAVEKDLNLIVPDDVKKESHHWLVLHGRYVCLARKPSCDKCIIKDLCRYYCCAER